MPRQNEDVGPDLAPDVARHSGSGAAARTLPLQPTQKRRLIFVSAVRPLRVFRAVLTDQADDTTDPTGEENPPVFLAS